MGRSLQNQQEHVGTIYAIRLKNTYVYNIHMLHMYATTIYATYNILLEMVVQDNITL